MDKETEIHIDTLLTQRKTLIDSQREAQRSLDNALITLSAGALGISLTFIHNISPQPVLVLLLVIAWVLFGAAVFCVLYSFRSSAKALKYHQVTVDERYRALLSHEIPRFEQLKMDRVSREKFARRTRRLNSIAIWAFSLGIILLGVFVVINLGREG